MSPQSCAGGVDTFLNARLGFNASALCKIEGEKAPELAFGRVLAVLGAVGFAGGCSTGLEGEPDIAVGGELEWGGQLEGGWGEWIVG